MPNIKKSAGAMICADCTITILSIATVLVAVAMVWTGTPELEALMKIMVSVLAGFVCINSVVHLRRVQRTVARITVHTGHA